jgi:hypothetical protein
MIMHYQLGSILSGWIYEVISAHPGGKLIILKCANIFFSQSAKAGNKFMREQIFIV